MCFRAFLPSVHHLSPLCARCLQFSLTALLITSCDQVSHTPPLRALQLLEWGFDPNTCDCTGEAPLHWAARWNRCQVAAALVGSGSRMEQPDKEGRTPMHVACENGRVAVLHELLRRGALGDPQDRRGRSPLCIAKFYAREDAAQVLTEHLNRSRKGAAPATQHSQRPQPPSANSTPCARAVTALC
mmetsp:Transcript_35990/g.101934  ORF Transcript_35990/g.101934 Transcript_35990/m.101934 type:complete len:186 (-) Transcript_35990:99-656(-)